MRSTLMSEPATERRRRIRHSVILWMLVAAAFYFGFIVLTLVRAHR